MTETRSILKDKSFAFALRCIKLYKYLSETKKEYILSKQLIRSGTSVGANIRESRNAETTPDFIHKMGIAQKECDETLYWLELLVESKYMNKVEFKSIYRDGEELLKILRSAILTTKQKKRR